MQYVLLGGVDPAEMEREISLVFGNAAHPSYLDWLAHLRASVQQRIAASANRGWPQPQKEERLLSWEAWLVEEKVNCACAIKCNFFPSRRCAQLSGDNRRYNY